MRVCAPKAFWKVNCHRYPRRTKKLGLLCFSKKFQIHPNESGFSKPFGICGLNMLPHHAHARIHGWRGWSFTTHLLGGAAPLFLGWWPGSWSNFAVKTPVKGAGGSSNHSKNWQFFVCRIVRMWTKTATSNLNRHVDRDKNATYYNFISDLVSKLCLNMDVVCILLPSISLYNLPPLITTMTTI